MTWLLVDALSRRIERVFLLLWHRLNVFGVVSANARPRLVDRKLQRLSRVQVLCSSRSRRRVGNAAEGARETSPRDAPLHARRHSRRSQNGRAAGQEEASGNGAFTRTRQPQIARVNSAARFSFFAFTQQSSATSTDAEQSAPTTPQPGQQLSADQKSDLERRPSWRLCIDDTNKNKVSIDLLFSTFTLRSAGESVCSKSSKSLNCCLNRPVLSVGHDQFSLEDSRGGKNAPGLAGSMTTADTVITIPLRRSKAQEEGMCVCLSVMAHRKRPNRFPVRRDERDVKGRDSGHDPAETPTQTALDGRSADRYGGTWRPI